MTKSTKEMNIRELGEHLGYPPCCIDHFDKTFDAVRGGSMERPMGRWVGTGFIPCPKHEKEIAAASSFKAWAKENITPNRKERVRFPKFHGGEYLMDEP